MNDFYLGDLFQWTCNFTKIEGTWVIFTSDPLFLECTYHGGIVGGFSVQVRLSVEDTEIATLQATATEDERRVALDLSVLKMYKGLAQYVTFTLDAENATGADISHAAQSVIVLGCNNLITAAALMPPLWSLRSMLMPPTIIWQYNSSRSNHWSVLPYCCLGAEAGFQSPGGITYFNELASTVLVTWSGVQNSWVLLGERHTIFVRNFNCSDFVVALAGESCFVNQSGPLPFRLFARVVDVKISGQNTSLQTLFFEHSYLRSTDIVITVQFPKLDAYSFAWYSYMLQTARSLNVLFEALDYNTFVGSRPPAMGGQIETKSHNYSPMLSGAFQDLNINIKLCSYDID